MATVAPVKVEVSGSASETPLSMTTDGPPSAAVTDPQIGGGDHRAGRNDATFENFEQQSRPGIVGSPPGRFVPRRGPLFLDPFGCLPQPSEETAFHEVGSGHEEVLNEEDR